MGSSSFIRLLRILDNDMKDDKEPIACELHVASTRDPYIALSYMWGDAEATETITVNGSPFRIRRNLWDFLHQRRKDQRRFVNERNEGDHQRDTQALYLWIDAICINQAGTKEKNHQVAMMGRIYSSAVGVIAWLGAASDPLEILDLIEKHGFDALKAWFSKDLWNGKENGNGRCRNLYEHEYWGRAWILQECILANELSIQCGSQLFSDTTLLHAVSGYSYLDYEFDDVGSLWGAYILRARARWHNASARIYYCPWSGALGPLGCSEPRDRIYAAIAIMDPALNIVPDYNITAEELFVVIADQHIEWNKERWRAINILAWDLCLANNFKDTDAPTAVRQRLREARAFNEFLKKRPGLTKSEFFAERQWWYQYLADSSDDSDDDLS